jgi:hypothetical protein
MMYGFAFSFFENKRDVAARPYMMYGLRYHIPTSTLAHAPARSGTGAPQATELTGKRKFKIV